MGIEKTCCHLISTFNWNTQWGITNYDNDDDDNDDYIYDGNDDVYECNYD